MTDEQKRLEKILFAHLEESMVERNAEFSDVSKIAMALIALWKCEGINPVQKCVLRVLEENNAFDSADKITILIERS